MTIVWTPDGQVKIVEESHIGALNLLVVSVIKTLKLFVLILP